MGRLVNLATAIVGASIVGWLVLPDRGTAHVVESMGKQMKMLYAGDCQAHYWYPHEGGWVRIQCRRSDDHLEWDPGKPHEDINYWPFPDDYEWFNEQHRLATE